MADYAPLDLVAATTMVRDKVRTIAHPPTPETEEGGVAEKLISIVGI